MSNNQLEVRYSESEIGNTGPGQIGPGASGGSPAPFSGAVMGTPCQLCGQMPIKQVELMYVMSFLVLTRHATYEALLCRSCSTRSALRELGKSAILGWWGIPWGLLTFRAIWINTRSLLRWSSVPAPAGLMLGLLALAPLGATGYWLFLDQQETTARRATGDYVADEVYDHVRKGHELYQAEDYEAALAEYRAADRLADDSSVISFSIAQTLVQMGDLAGALPHAAHAEELNPQDQSHAAMHGWILASMGDREGAQERVERLRGQRPDENGSFAWLEALFTETEQWDALATACDLALETSPGDAYVRGVKLSALVGIDDVQGAQALYDSLGEVDRQEPVVAFAADLLAMRRDPIVHTESLLESWGKGEYSPATLRRMAAAAERSGELEAVRARVRSWLESPESPGDAWYGVEAWFEPETQNAMLDGYLARRKEAAPGMMRLTSLDRIRDRQAIERLAGGLKELDHPFAETFELAYLNAHWTGLSRPERTPELLTYVGKHPDSRVARFRLLALLIEDRPEQARPVLEELRAEAGEEAELKMALRTLETALTVSEGDLGRARRLAEGLDPQRVEPYLSPEAVSLLRAEIGLFQRDLPFLLEHLAPVTASADPERRPAGFLVRWSAQYAFGQELTYRQDVDGWLAELGEGGGNAQSYTAQGILLAEGRVEPGWALQAVGPQYPETLELVAFFSDLARSGAPDEARLRAIAASPWRHDPAPRLARTLLEGTRTETPSGP